MPTTVFCVDSVDPFVYTSFITDIQENVRPVRVLLHSEVDVARAYAFMCVVAFVCSGGDVQPDLMASVSNTFRVDKTKLCALVTHYRGLLEA